MNKLYDVSPQNNDSFAFCEAPDLGRLNGTPAAATIQAVLPDFSGGDLQGVLRCPTCSELLNKWEHHLHGLVIKRRRYDFSTTYDGVTTASSRFKELYESEGLAGLEFCQLPDDRKFYKIMPCTIVKYRVEGSHVQFINQCSACGRWESVIGSMPVVLRAGSVVPSNGFVRSDLEFASNDEKSPLFICGEEVRQWARKHRIRGMYFHPATIAEG